MTVEIRGKYANSSIALKQGIVIDLQKRIYVIFTTLFGFLKYKEVSQPLPEANYILIFRTLYNKCQSCNIADFENDSVMQLSLVHHQNKKLIVHESNDKDEIMRMAKQLAAELHIAVRDAATDRRNPKWIEL